MLSWQFWIFSALKLVFHQSPVKTARNSVKRTTGQELLSFPGWKSSHENHLGSSFYWGCHCPTWGVLVKKLLLKSIIFTNPRVPSVGQWWPHWDQLMPFYLICILLAQGDAVLLTVMIQRSCILWKLWIQKVKGMRSKQEKRANKSMKIIFRDTQLHIQRSQTFLHFFSSSWPCCWLNKAVHKDQLWRMLQTRSISPGRES